MKLSFALMFSACSAYGSSAIGHRSQLKLAAYEQMLEKTLAGPTFDFRNFAEIQLRMTKPKPRANRRRPNPRFSKFLRHHRNSQH